VGNWNHGRQDLPKKKGGGGKSSKTGSDFFFFFLVWHNTKRTSERAVLTPPGIYKEFEVFVSSTHKKTTESLVFSRQAATTEELHDDQRSQGRGERERGERRRTSMTAPKKNKETN